MVAAAGIRSTRMSVVSVDTINRNLLPKIESLGDNCELGFILRKQRYEKGGLLRWAVTPADKLVEFLKNPEQELFKQDDFHPSAPDMVRDQQSGFAFHSKMRSERDSDGELQYTVDKAERAAIYPAEKSKIDYLQAGFIERLKAESGSVYVIKSNNGIDESLVLEIASALKKYNDRHVLIEVRSNASAINGGVLENQGIHYVAHIQKFAPYTQADDCVYEQWNEIFSAVENDQDIVKKIALKALPPFSVSGGLPASKTSNNMNKEITPDSKEKTQLAICIGAPRSGTTWLFSQLRKSASVFAPPVKEVRYLHGKRSAEQEISNMEHARAKLAINAEDELFLDKLSKAKYDDFDEYTDLMLGSTDKPWSMDISPIYSTMPKPAIEKLGEYFNYDVKIIMLVRDCVDRAYSQANLHFHMHGKFDKPANHSEYLSLLSTKQQLKRSNYPATIDNWVNTFGAGNFHLCFYEDLASDPLKTLKSVFDFLGVSDYEEMAHFEEKSVGSSKDKQFVQAPKTLKPLLAAQLFPIIDEMSKRYPDKCAKWRHNANAHLDKVG